MGKAIRSHDVDSEEQTSLTGLEIQSEIPYTRDRCGVCSVGLHHEVHASTLNAAASASEGCRACAGIGRFLALGGAKPPSRPESIERGQVRYEYFTKTKIPTVWGRLKPPVRKDPSPSTSSAQTFDTLKHWISECEVGHRRCDSAPHGPLPHRILKIETIEPMAIRLVENDPSMERYACLSYRWGSNTAINSLKIANLAVYKRGVPDQFIYPLVRDAIVAAWRVGLTYIWIDSYCIVQDDELDWSREAAAMGEIYENAFITLSATTATDGDGLFSDIDPFHVGHPITELGQTPVFIRRCLYHPRLAAQKRNREHFNLPADEDKSTLSRGWVFQERILSMRFVHFLKDEIFWECRESTWCQCRAQEESWKKRRAQVPRVLESLDWGDLIREYCTTSFTYEKDRLQALSGVARRYGAVHGKTFVAGMWFEDLPRTILWDYHTPAPKKLRPSGRTAASWSWTFLSAQGELPTYWVDIDDRWPCDLDFLGYHRDPPVADIYTDLHSVSLTLAGLTVMGTIFPQEGYVKTSEFLWALNPDFDMQPDDPSKFRAVESGSDILILLCGYRGSLILQDTRLGSGQGTGTTFERIGRLGGRVMVDSSKELQPIFPSSTDEMEQEWYRVENQQFLDRAERRTITLV